MRLLRLLLRMMFHAEVRLPSPSDTCILGRFPLFYLLLKNLVLPPGRRPYGPEAGPGQSAAGGMALPTQTFSGAWSLHFAVIHSH